MERARFFGMLGLARSLKRVGFSRDEWRLRVIYFKSGFTQGWYANK